MIYSIKLHNFQAHADTSIELAAGVTALVGSSNSGKTAITRGFRFVQTNRPKSTSIIRSGEDNVSVTLHIGEHTISRTRGKKRNDYKLDDQTFQALGGAVPEQITELLNLQDINTSSQLAPHFLILDTPGKIAREINTVVHLEDAEKTVDKIRTNIRATKSDIKSIGEQQEVQNAVLSKYYQLGVYKDTLDTAIATQASLATCTTSLNSLDSLLDGIDTVCQEIEDNQLPVGIEELLDEVEKQSKLVQGLVTRWTSLDCLLDDISRTEVEQYDFTEIDSTIGSVTILTQKLINDSKSVLTLYNLIDDIQNIESEQEQEQKELDRMQTLLDEIEFCPTCGKAI